MATYFATTEGNYRGSNSTLRLHGHKFTAVGKTPRLSGTVNRGPRAAADNTRGTEAERNARAAELFPMLQRVARKMRAHLPAHVEVDDLVGAGSVGLVDAIGKFDPRKRVKIESYAQHRIRGAILDSLRTMDGASRDLRRKIKQAERVHHELEAKLGHPATDPEMARAQGLSLKDWYRTLRDFQPLGIDWLRPAGHVAEQFAAENLPAAITEDQFDLCYRREKIDILNRALAGLSERERLIMSLYYARERTMKQIGSQLKIDESRVSQLHSAALVRLRIAVTSLTREAQTCPPPLDDGVSDA
jgi:RNA polymerase sigma factor FliA